MSKTAASLLQRLRRLSERIPQTRWDSATLAQLRAIAEELFRFCEAETERADTDRLLREFVERRAEWIDPLELTELRDFAGEIGACGRFGSPSDVQTAVAELDKQLGVIEALQARVADSGPAELTALTDHLQREIATAKTLGKKILASRVEGLEPPVAEAPDQCESEPESNLDSETPTIGRQDTDQAPLTSDHPSTTSHTTPSYPSSNVTLVQRKLCEDPNRGVIEQLARERLGVDYIPAPSIPDPAVFSATAETSPMTPGPDEVEIADEALAVEADFAEVSSFVEPQLEETVPEEREITGDTQAAPEDLEGAIDHAPEGNQQACEEETDLTHVFWTAIQRREWGWALFLANHADEGVVAGLLPAWLVEGLQLSQHSCFGGPSSVDAKERLAEIAGSHFRPHTDQDSPYSPRLMGLALAAAALPACFDVTIGKQVNAWLEESLRFEDAWSGLEQTYKLLKRTQSVVAQVDSKVWTALGGSQTLEERLTQVLSDLKDWHARLEHPRQNHAPAGAALRELVSSQQKPIRRIHDLIADNDPANASQVENALKELPDNLREYAEGQYRQYHRQHRRGRHRDVEGAALSWFESNLKQFVSLAKEWSDTARQLASLKSGPMQTSRVDDLKREWHDDWQSVCRELAPRRFSGVDAQGLTVVRELVAHSVSMVACDIMHCQTAEAIQPPRPLFPHEIENEQVMWFFPDEEPDAAAVAEKYNSPHDLGALPQHVDSLISEGHFPLALRIIDVLETTRTTDTETLARLRDEAEQAVEVSRKELADRCSRLDSELREAVAQGWLDSTEERSVERDLMEAQSELEEGQFDSGRLSLLLDSLSLSIDNLRKRKCSDLRRRLAELSEQVNREQGEIRENAEYWLAEAKRYLEAQEIGLSEQSLELVEDALRGNPQVVSDASCASFREWLSRCGDIYKWLADKQSNRDPFHWGGVSSSRRTEFKNMRTAFKELRLSGHDSPEDRAKRSLGPLRVILQDYIGFPNANVEQRTTEQNSSVRQSYNLTCNPIINRALIPVPQFGSCANGHYRVEVVWEHPQADTLLQSISAMRSDIATILIYVGRMSPGKRMQWRNLLPSAGHGVSCILLDEVLLCHLGDQKSDRMRVLFECALPYTTINPYQPAGQVEPEMFYGRDRDLERLEDPLGPCIVYGGRQLGKSAILRHLQRRLDLPDEECWVIKEDIRDRGRDACWSPLASWLNNHTRKKRPLQTPEQIADGIIEFLGDQRRRLFLLLDESDSFIADDAAHNFENIWQLRRIMDATSRRFKVILAGLQDVQRYSHLHNQPLAQMGQPINVGPLPVKDATELIRRPLSALGYDIGPRAAMKIRLYTDSHPGLIQYFCQQLVELRRERRRTSSDEVFHISQEDVDQIYGRNDTRKAISDRFVWTVVLDPYYKALVYSLLYEVASTYMQQNRAFTAREALEITQSYCPDVFANMGLDEARAMLGELEGLGVLQRVAKEERWKVRNSQVISLLGGKHEIEERLLEVIEQPQPLRPRPSEQHPRFGSDGILSPMSSEEFEKVLGTVRPGDNDAGKVTSVIRSGSLILLSSKALGGDLVASAVRAMYCEEHVSSLPWQMDEVRSFQSIDPAKLAQELRETLQRPAQAAKLIWFRESDAAADFERLFDCCAEIDDVLATMNRALPFPVRVVLELGPSLSWQWLARRRDRVMPASVSDMNMRRWQVRDLEIWGRNEQLHDPHGKLANELQALTGGWYCLVSRLRQHLIDTLGPELSNKDPQQAFDSFSAWRCSDDGRTYLRAFFPPRREMPEPAQYLWSHLDRPLTASEIDLVADLSEGQLSPAECDLGLEWLRCFGYLNAGSSRDRDGEIAYVLEPVAHKITEEIWQDA